MTDPYAPVYLPGEKYPRITSAAVTAGQVLVVSGSDTVAPSAGASSAWVGVAANSAASGGAVTAYALHAIPGSVRSSATRLPLVCPLSARSASQQ